MESIFFLLLIFAVQIAVGSRQPSLYSNSFQLRGRKNAESKTYSATSEPVPENVIRNFQSNNLSVGVWSSGPGNERVFAPIRPLFTDWGNFSFELQNQTLSQFPIAVKSIDTISSRTSICNILESVQTLWTAVSVRAEVNINCSGANWNSKICPSGQVTVCVDCNNPCETQNNLFGFITTPYNLSYPSWSQIVHSSQFNITVEFDLSGVGVFTCAAFPHGRVPKSVLAITNTKGAATYRANSSASLSGSLLLEGLMPESSYIVYCYTRSLDFSNFEVGISPLYDTLDRALLVITTAAPIPVITVGFSNSSLMVNQFPIVIPVSLPYKPSQNITVFPLITYYSDSFCSDNMTVDIVEGEEESYRFVPQMLSFSDSLNLQQVFYLQTTKTGCYRLQFEILTSDSGSRVVSPFNLQRNRISGDNVVDQFFFNSSFASLPATVEVESVKFTMSSGLIVLMTFTGETDEGGSFKYRLDFPCAEILSFPSSYKSTCRFASATQLKIFPSTKGSNLLLPGDQVIILPDKLKAKCVSNRSSDCDFTPYLSISPQTVTVSETVKVEAVIAAPSLMVAGSNLTLDLSLSLGNGGRPWLVEWEVLLDNRHTAISDLIQSYLNTELLWNACPVATIHCDTIPKELLNHPGYYTFRLTLTNFLGLSSRASFKILIKNQQFVPSVRLLAANYGTTWQNRSITIRSVIDIGDYQCPSPLSISWMVFRGSVLDASLVKDTKLYKDTRTYVVNAFGLKAGEEYRFRIIVFCGNYYAFDEATFYVIPSVVTPFFSSGRARTLPLNQAMTFDVSSGYSEVPGGLEGIYFQWNCYQIVPISQEGCRNIFDHALFRNNTRTSLLLLNPSAVFNVSATYVISATAISHFQRTSFTASQRLTITRASSTPVVQAKVVQQFTANNSFGYQIDALVSGRETFVAVWKILTTNTTVTSKTFVNGGIQNFPLVIPSAMLGNRLTYSFSLSAFAVSGSCRLLSCADPGLVSSSVFSVQVNQPPANGYVSSIPPTGTDATIFSIFANGWQDDHLPMYYAFYQSYYRTSGFNMIRNRMQINYMAGTLSAPIPGFNNTVFVQGEISDYYGATASASVQVTVAAREVNATNVIANTKKAIARMFNQLNPEIIFPVACEIVNALHNLNCSTSSNRTRDCVALIAAGSSALEQSLAFYNTGATLVTGLSKYTSFFSDMNQNSISSSFRSLLSLYQYLNQAVSSVGLSRFTATQLVDALMHTADEMANTYKSAWLSSSEDSENDDLVEILESQSLFNQTEDVLSWIEQSVNLLSVSYFNVLPFGVTRQFLTDHHFNVTMTRDYFLSNSPIPAFLSQVLGTNYSASSEAGTIIEDLFFSGQLFPPNLTSSYSYLNSVSLLPRALMNRTTENDTISRFERYENKFIILNTNTMLLPGRSLNASIYLKGVNLSNPVFLFALAMPDSVRTDPVVKHHHCNQSRDVPEVTCTAEETNGLVYSFPDVACPQAGNAVLTFTCPLYVAGFVCTNHSRPVTAGHVVHHSLDTAKTLLRCDYPLYTGVHVSVSSRSQHPSANSETHGSGLSVTGSFSFEVETEELVSPQVQVYNPINEINDPEVRRAVTILAIVSLVAAGVVFAAVMMYRVKLLVDSPMPLLSGRGGGSAVQGRGGLLFPQTHAQYILPPVIANNTIVMTRFGGTETNTEASSVREGSLSTRQIEEELRAVDPDSLAGEQVDIESLSNEALASETDDCTGEVPVAEEAEMIEYQRAVAFISLNDP